MVAGPFNGHTGWVWSVAFSTDGQRVVSGSVDEQFVCGTPRQETWWQAHLLDTRTRSGLWHSRQMASASSQALLMKQFVCGTPRPEPWQAHLQDTLVGCVERHDGRHYLPPHPA